MKAIRVQEFGGPEVMRAEEIPVPAPGDGQYLVRVHAVGVNPVDTYIRSGAYAAKPALPYTPGKDAAGVIEGAGEGASGFKPGDRVYVADSLTGTYAEYALCRASQIHRLPSKISFAQGAAINVPYATAYRALFQRAKGLAGETVLVHGATGGVGIAAVQLARAGGMRVLGTGGSEDGRKRVAAEGAHRVFDHGAADYQRQIMDFTGGRGADVIVEMLSNVNLGKDLTMLAKGGRVAIIGSRGSVEINPRDAMARDAVILGVMLGNASEKEMESIHAGLAAGLENGTLRPVVGREFPLSKASAAHQAVMEPGAQGKIVLIP